MTDSIKELSLRGKESLIKGDLVTAKDIFTRMTTDYPDEPVGYANLGQICYETGDHEGAIRNYETAIKMDATKFVKLQNRLYLLESPRQLYNCLNDLERLLKSVS